MNLCCINVGLSLSLLVANMQSATFEQGKSYVLACLLYDFLRYYFDLVKYHFIHVF